MELSQPVEEAPTLRYRTPSMLSTGGSARSTPTHAPLDAPSGGGPSDAARQGRHHHDPYSHVAVPPGLSVRNHAPPGSAHGSSHSGANGRGSGSPGSAGASERRGGANGSPRAQSAAGSGKGSASASGGGATLGDAASCTNVSYSAQDTTSAGSSDDGGGGGHGRRGDDDDGDEVGESAAPDDASIPDMWDNTSDVSMSGYSAHSAKCGEMDNTPESYFVRLVKFYQKYNPDKLCRVEEFLAAYKGEEEQLFAILTEKYGPEPEPDTRSAATGSDGSYFHALGARNVVPKIVTPEDGKTTVPTPYWPMSSSVTDPDLMALLRKQVTHIAELQKCFIGVLVDHPADSWNGMTYVTEAPLPSDTSRPFLGHLWSGSLANNKVLVHNRENYHRSVLHCSDECRHTYPHARWRLTLIRHEHHPRILLRTMWDPVIRGPGARPPASSMEAPQGPPVAAAKPFFSFSWARKKSAAAASQAPLAGSASTSRAAAATAAATEAKQQRPPVPNFAHSAHSAHGVHSAPTPPCTRAVSARATPTESVVSSTTTADTARSSNHTNHHQHSPPLFAAASRRTQPRQPQAAPSSAAVAAVVADKIAAQLEALEQRVLHRIAALEQRLGRLEETVSNK